MDDDLGYMYSIPPEVKEIFFYELSRYSFGQLLNYFTHGIIAVDKMEDLGGVHLPGDIDHRRDLVQEYLLCLPESFRMDFRACLENEVQRDDDAEEVIFI